MTLAPHPDLRVPSSSLPQQSEKSWAAGVLGSGPGWPRPRSLGASGQVGISCLSSLTAWLGTAVLYRKLAMEEEVAVGSRSWGGPLEAWPCRLQSRDPLAISETPFSSTRAFESRPPSSSGLGEGHRTQDDFVHWSYWPHLLLCSPLALSLQNMTACEVRRVGASPQLSGRGAGLRRGRMCLKPHSWTLALPLGLCAPVHQLCPFSCS